MWAERVDLLHCKTVVMRNNTKEAFSHAFYRIELS